MYGLLRVCLNIHLGQYKILKNMALFEKSSLQFIFTQYTGKQNSLLWSRHVSNIYKIICIRYLEDLKLHWIPSFWNDTSATWVMTAQLSIFVGYVAYILEPALTQALINTWAIACSGGIKKPDGCLALNIFRTSDRSNHRASSSSSGSTCEKECLR